MLRERVESSGSAWLMGYIGVFGGCLGKSLRVLTAAPVVTTKIFVYDQGRPGPSSGFGSICGDFRISFRYVPPLFFPSIFSWERATQENGVPGRKWQPRFGRLLLPHGWAALKGSAGPWAAQNVALQPPPPPGGASLWLGVSVPQRAPEVWRPFWGISALMPWHWGRQGGRRWPLAWGTSGGLGLQQTKLEPSNKTVHAYPLEKKTFLNPSRRAYVEQI